ncbi:hypothetical protein lerEdw1_016784 [Lerista edwardsae]|nr:hypothetical protein lerEdw1_016784 [Lerista edwardsae]
MKHLFSTIPQDQQSSEEEESDGGNEDDEDYDEKEEIDEEVEEQDAAAKHDDDDQVPEHPEQSSKSLANEEAHQLATETIEKEEAAPEDFLKQEAEVLATEDISQHHGHGSENPEVHATNHSSEAATDGYDNRTSGRLMEKTKRFSLFRLKSSKQKNAHSCDENRQEKLPHSEQAKQVGRTEEHSTDENENQTRENQKEPPPADQGRKASSTCVIL